MLFTLISRRELSLLSLTSRRHLSSTAVSTLRSKYSFTPPPSLHPPKPPDPKSNPPPPPIKPKKPRNRPPSTLNAASRPQHTRGTPSFDFRFSYTEFSPSSRPIGLREPRYSPFGPGRIDREWTGFSAPVKIRKVTSVDGDGMPSVEEEEERLAERRRVERERLLGPPLSEAEKKIIVDETLIKKNKRQVNLGRDGLTHNMLNDIHNHWKHAEAVRIKCMGVPTMDMKNVCSQLEDKTFGKIIHRHGGLLVLYRGRKYKPRKRPVIPLMLWKPSEPIYPKLIKTTIEGLSIEETKEMRKKGLAVPALTKLGRNKFYGNLLPMVKDAFLVAELVRIDCSDLDKSDLKKVGVKLRDLVPCILVTFMKEQIVVWRGKDYQPTQYEAFLSEQEPFSE